MSVEQRFLAKVEKHDSDCPCCKGCWHWTAARSIKGYGRFGLGGKNRLAHTVAYELFVGSIPDGLRLDHLCRVRHCVNPAHLEPVTNAENLRRGSWPHNRFKTACARGHELTTIASGGRTCKICSRASAERYLARKRARGEIGLPMSVRTHCPRGHAYDDANTYVGPNGGRQCRACRRDRQRRRRAALSTR